MNFEKVLLHTLRFDLQVEQPYNHLIEYLKIFHIEDKEIKREVGTKAWTFINDSYSTTLCLMWYPEVSVFVPFIYLPFRSSPWPCFKWPFRW